MDIMSGKIRLVAVLALALAAAACATAGGGGAGGPTVDSRFMQADQKLPAQSAFEEAAGVVYRDSNTHKARGDQARESGNLDQAKAEWIAAADGFASIPEKYGTSEWQIPLLYNAAGIYMQAGAYEKAAQTAARAATDPHAAPVTKALANYLAAQAWLQVGTAAAKAGQLEPIRLPTFDQRNGAPLKPRPPPGAWKPAVDAIDGYLANADADPEAKKPLAERRRSPAMMAVTGAHLEYAFDNMEEARRRFEAILEKYPDDTGALAEIITLYPQTFRTLGDDAGYQAALTRMSNLVDQKLAKASDEKTKGELVKIKESLAQSGVDSQFAAAEKLLAAGKPGDAAALFETVSEKGGSNAAGALHNAAIAWDKAGQPAKGAAVRVKLLKDYPDYKLAAQNALLLAQYTGQKGEHAAAAKQWQDFLQRWPDSPNRCLALYNVGAEFDSAKKASDAIESYLAFGKDAACLKSDPNWAATALYQAGVLLSQAKKTERAREAFKACAGVSGVTDIVAKSKVEDAKTRLKGK